MIFNIQRYSIHDGEGIRTIIFFKGCPLRCPWCSNPESQTYGPSLMYDQRLCKDFGDCLSKGEPAITTNNGTISIDRSIVKDAEMLREVCAANALTVVGKEMSIREIMDEIEKDIPFYHQSGGGVTLSGGEPLSQNGLLVPLMEKLNQQKVHLSVETSLHVTWKQIERCLKLVDCFMVDLKHVDKQKFNSITSGDADLVLDNLHKLNDLDQQIIIRIPVVPDFNHSEEEMIRIIDTVTVLKSVHEIHFIPYHTLGSEKYKMLGMDYSYKNHKNIQESEITPYLKYANSKGLKTKIGG
jgi:pyruvate formate lyase activating enzyme